MSLVKLILDYLSPPIDKSLTPDMKISLEKIKLFLGTEPFDINNTIDSLSFKDYLKALEKTTEKSKLPNVITFILLLYDTNVTADGQTIILSMKTQIIDDINNLLYEPKSDLSPELLNEMQDAIRQQKKLEAIKTLVNKPQFDINASLSTPPALFDAIDTFNVDIVKLVLLMGANPKQPFNGKTPHAYLIEKTSKCPADKQFGFLSLQTQFFQVNAETVDLSDKHNDFIAAIKSGNVRTAQQLISDGFVFNPITCKENDVSAIQLAVNANSFEMVELLIAQGAILTSPDLIINSDMPGNQLLIAELIRREKIKRQQILIAFCKNHDKQENTLQDALHQITSNHTDATRKLRALHANLVHMRPNALHPSVNALMQDENSDTELAHALNQQATRFYKAIIAESECFKINGRLYMSIKGLIASIERLEKLTGPFGIMYGSGDPRQMRAELKKNRAELIALQNRKAAVNNLLEVKKAIDRTFTVSDSVVNNEQVYSIERKKSKKRLDSDNDRNEIKSLTSMMARTADMLDYLNLITNKPADLPPAFKLAVDTNIERLAIESNGVIDNGSAFWQTVGINLLIAAAMIALVVGVLAIEGSVPGGIGVLSQFATSCGFGLSNLITAGTGLSAQAAGTLAGATILSLPAILLSAGSGCAFFHSKKLNIAESVEKLKIDHQPPKSKS